MSSRQLDQAADHLLDLDDRTHRLFGPYKDSWPVRALAAPSKIGDQPELRLIAVGLIAAGIFAKSDRLVRAGSRMMIAHETATFVKDRVKGHVDRTRPRSSQDREDKKPKKGNHHTKEQNSFPSGHTAGAIAVARAFSREFPEYREAALGAAGMMATLQVVRCAHYPTDVLAGLIIGLGSEAAVNAAWNGVQMDARSEGQSP